MIKPILKYRMGTITAVAVPVVLMIVVAACAHARLTWKGTLATQENNVALMTGGVHKGFWKTGDIEVNYDYTVKDGIFSIKGTVGVAFYIENGFRTLRNFSVYMNLLDDSKRILDSRLIVVTGAGVPIRLFRYQAQIPVPQNAVAINFSYAGIAQEGGGIQSSGEGDGVSYEFWKNP